MRLLRVVPWLLLVLVLALPQASRAQVAVGVSIHIGPPVIPVYPQPVIPGPGYIWTPGYWAYGPGGYYWVPGTWVLPPTVGVLWTPGYWGYTGGAYIWHAGYWGPHVGFYGGVNYGYGYTGYGFAGGYWRGGAYYYNRSVANVNTTVIHNTYNTTVVERNVSRVSYNGGEGGLTARPTTNELAAERERHAAATSVQMQHERAASTNRAMWASSNHGQPSVAATARPGVFRGEGVVAARPADAARIPASSPNRPVNGAYAGGQAKESATGGPRPAGQPGQVQRQDQARPAGQYQQPQPQHGQQQAQHQGQQGQQRQEGQRGEGQHGGEQHQGQGGGGKEHPNKP